MLAQSGERFITLDLAEDVGREWRLKLVDRFAISIYTVYTVYTLVPIE